ncbi:DUF4225 domain-containing protein [Pseudomonas viridiflava]|uniref:DUF4225 domain-containing protein n=1 Tax=Pseudomonas viridiflava TaxID=33069 RepID=UPI00211D898D|nr:DUF4225 domain-containing protein [Pseudomonas viridiflava]MCQ9393767.1 DUF4225 domain-containing protein [Pseudomonas viridiflava]
MSLPERQRSSGHHDLWRVSEAAGHLAGQACTVSARHIRDGTLRLQFNRDVAYYAQGIVRDVEAGRKSVDEGLEAIETTQRSFVEQSLEIGKKSVGILAGTLQVTNGVAVCYGSFGTLCLVFGVPLMAHGANNIYENGRNLIEDRSDTQGPTRKAYHALSKLAGGTEFHGNMAYGTVDLGLSLYGMGRLVVKPEAWKLFEYVRADKIRGYQDISGKVFTAERGGDTLTLESLYKEWDKHHDD